MLESYSQNAVDPRTSAACAGRESAPELTRAVSAGTGTTTVESGQTCGPGDTAFKYVTIIDVDASIKNPSESLTFQWPTIHNLTKGKGPSKIMMEARPHKANLRWIHLRANCMGWIEDLMEKLCEERGFPVGQASNVLPAERRTIKNPLLREDLWGKLYYGKDSRSINSRFMKPICSPFSISIEDEESDSSSETPQSMDNLVLYLPFLHWESRSNWRKRQKCLQAVTDGHDTTPYTDRDLLKEYIHHKSPLHDRRTLTQAYYYNHSKNESLGNGQVIQRTTSSTNDPEEEKMIMVDQLWLWVIKGRKANTDGIVTPEPDLVITAFPERFDGARDPSANVYQGIVEHLQRGLHPPLKSTNELLAVIVEHCTGVFFQRRLSPKLWFLEFYASAIGLVKKRQNVAFNDFCQTSRELIDLQCRNASFAKISEKQDELFSINVETSLIAEIKSVIDELEYIDFFSNQQQDVLSSLARAQNSRSFSSRSIRHVCEMVKERRNAWAGAKQTALQTYAELRDQMDLKQKQANVSEARSSRKQAEASARHGRIILLFTVVTIIFLPMSFLTGWFGMNANDLNGGKLGLSFIAAIIFPISIAIAVFALALAFNEAWRNFVVGLFQNVIDFMPGASSSGALERSQRRRMELRERAVA